MAGAEIATVMTTLKTLLDVAGGTIALRDEAKLQEALLELQALAVEAGAEALTAQNAHQVVEKENRDLRERISEFENFEKEKHRYKLTDFGSHSFARELILEAANGEPHHLLCDACFEQRRKSRLHLMRALKNGSKMYYCPACGEDVRLGDPPPLAAPQVRGKSGPHWMS